MDHVLEVKCLSKTYTDFVLNNINFSLPAGYIMGLIGSNGSGKTTTIKAILNMVTPDNGNVFVFEKDHIESEQDIKREIGVVFDESYFVDDWNMADVEKAFTLFYDSWDSKKYWSLLVKFRITKDKLVKELS